MKLRTPPVFSLIVVLSFFGLALFAATNAQEANNFPESTLPNARAIADANRTTVDALANKPVSTELVRNYWLGGLTLQDQLEVLPARARLWDVNLVYYTKAFADRQGLPANRVLALPDGLEVIAYTQQSAGASLDCKLNVLIRDNLGIALPEQDYQGPGRNVLLKFPRALQKPKTYERAHLVEIYEPTHRDYGLGRMTGKGAATATVSYYKHGYYTGYDYFSFRIPCAPYLQEALASGDSALWLKKVGGADYTKRTHMDPNDFIKLPLPQALVDAMLPLMREGYAFTRDHAPKVQLQNNR